MSGFLAISRKLFLHDFWTERREFSRAEAWLDLIRRANWEDANRIIGNSTFHVKRGELIASEREMSAWWGWSQKRVQNFIKLGVNEAMIGTTKESVGTRISLTKYDSYNSGRNQEGITFGKEHGEGAEEKGNRKESGKNQINGSYSSSYAGSGITNESGKNHLGIRKESLGNQKGIAAGIKLNNKQEEKEKQEEQPPTAAGGFDFEKLAKQVGGTCAKLIIEGGVTNMMDNPKKKLFVKWANHKFTSGNEIRTTAVMLEVVKKFQETDLALLDASISESISGNYARLVISKPSATEKKPLPNYWKPGMEAELKLTTEQTIEYHRHLIALGWYKTTEQGRPYWNRPQNNGNRTGETTLAAAMKPAN